jgi:hypothetical protein
MARREMSIVVLCDATLKTLKWQGAEFLSSPGGKLG